MQNKPQYPIVCLVLLFAFFLAAPAAGQSIGLETAVEKQTVFMGESFVFQLKINGSDSPREPQLEGFDDFDVTSLGGTNSSSQSITIINGQMQQQVTRSYIFQYRLTPRKTGTLTIPAVMVNVEGRNLVSDSIRITVREPVEVSDYKLRLALSSNTCYLGEPVILTLTWYIALNADDISFNFSLLDDKRFMIEPVTSGRSSNVEYLNFPVNGTRVEFEYPAGEINYQGRKYRTLSFKRALLPKTSGRLALGKAFVEFTGVTGYRNTRDWFGRVQRQEEYGKFVIPSNALSLVVRELPAAGRPVNFSGLIGTHFDMKVSAYPVKVKVGDPITLRVELSGPLYLEDVKLPHLNTIKELTNSFKIPLDQAPGKVEGNKKVFTQILRATSVDVDSIPVFNISYFNTSKGKYETMQSAAIPLEVEASEIKTFLDLEGMEPVEMKSELEAWTEGIAHNYEGSDVLKDQSTSLQRAVGNPLFILLMILPVITFLVLFYITRFSHLIKVSEADKKSRKAYSALSAILNKVAGKNARPAGADIYGVLIEELNKYIGAKLRIKSGALTFKDVETGLKQHAVHGEILEDLRQVYKTCEAGHYAGGALAGSGISDLSALIHKTVREIERSFKK